jgi:3-hydroxybutyryl-CoA dehydrogenase
MNEITISTIAVVGSGYMGGGIAQVLALSGRTVHLADVSAEAAEAARNRLLEEAKAYETGGLFPHGSTQLLTDNLVAAQSIEDAVAAADYVTEAVPENIALKREIFARISAAARPGTILTTNTSAIPVHKLVDVVTDPSRFLGVHWMNPAPFVPGVEIIPGKATAPEVVDAAMALVTEAGKVPALVADVAGFVANRLQFALYKEALAVVDEGLATPADVDKVVSSTFGFRLALFGPFAIGDMAGLDVYEASYRTLAEQYGERFQPPAALAGKVASGDLGLKTGGGFLGIDPAAAGDLSSYRNSAYQALSALRAKLGTPPGLPR